METITVKKTSVYRLADYGTHLKNLSDDDKFSRFGYNAPNHMIDQLILRMVYHIEDNELWYAKVDDKIVGWGHMVKDTDTAWELAVSVDKEYQRRGIGNKLIEEMIQWAKVHDIGKVYMHCIEQNRVIQHLAIKNKLETRSREAGERTAIIEVPNPTIADLGQQFWKEQKEILAQLDRLGKRFTDLWSLTVNPKHIDM